MLASGDLHAGRWSHPPPLRLWYKAAPQDPARIDSADTLTEVSVHYGGGDPFFGFQKVQGGKVVNKDYVAELVYRRGNPGEYADDAAVG